MHTLLFWFYCLNFVFLKKYYRYLIGSNSGALMYKMRAWQSKQ